MGSLRTWVSEIMEVLTMTRGFIPVMRATSRYKSAVVLQSRGKSAEARQAAQDALFFLRRVAAPLTNPPALTVLLPATELFADLSVSVADRDAANAALTEALAVCREALAKHPRFAEWEHFATHMTAIERRLGEQVHLDRDETRVGSPS